MPMMPPCWFTLCCCVDGDGEDGEDGDGVVEPLQNEPVEVEVTRTKIDNINFIRPLINVSKNDIYKLARKSYFAEEILGFSKDNSQFYTRSMWF